MVPVDMSGKARDLSPTTDHVDLQPPAKRPRISEVPNGQPYTDLISVISLEEQNPVSYVENVDPDCQRDLLCKSIRDANGFDKTSSKQNSTTEHIADDLAVTSELKGLVGNSDERNVCFGMVSNLNCFTTNLMFIVQVPNIKATYEKPGSDELPESFSVSLDSSSRFSSKEYNFIQGHIQPEHRQMLQGLLEEESLIIHIVCIIGDRMPSKKRARSVALQPCTLELSIYGPKSLFDDIGSWFQDYEIYLQDPRICHLEAKYFNPQRLSSDNIDASPLVSEVVTRTLVLMPKEVPECHDFLELLSSRVDLEETPQPSAIRATLKR